MRRSIPDRIRRELPIFRITVTLGFLALAVAVTGAAFWIVGAETPQGNVLINLGTEIMGIVITVAVVEYFFERRRLQGRARQLAFGALHAVQHAVWVWQGGPREVETDEVLAILHGVKDEDPFPEFTQNLMLNIGTRSREALNNDPHAVLALQGLAEAFEHFMRLSSIRDGRVPEPTRVASILADGVRTLATVLNLPDERLLARLIRYRDPSEAGQEQRYYGLMMRRPQAGPRSFSAGEEDF